MAKLFLLVLCVAVLGVGCGEKAEEKAIEKKIARETGKEVEVDLSKKGMTVSGETEGGKYTVTTGESVDVPVDFPSDVLIYRPSRAVASMKIPEGYSVTLMSPDGVPKIVETYKREMKAKGWSEETSMNISGQTVLVYEKEGRNANFMIAPLQGETQITVAVTND